MASLQAPGTTPAQPFPNHEMPPFGWYCYPAPTPESVFEDAHACECLGMVGQPVCKVMKQDQDEDGTPIGDPYEGDNSNNNSKCKVWCHVDNCACERLCKKDS